MKEDKRVASKHKRNEELQFCVSRAVRGWVLYQLMSDLATVPCLA